MAKVRALPGRLEEQPLKLLRSVGLGDCRDLVLCVVLVDEVSNDCARLPVVLMSMRGRGMGTKSVPEDEIVVLVVDDGRDATVRVELDVLGRLLLILFEVKIYGVIGQAEFFENDGNLPVCRMSEGLGRRKDGVPAVGGVVMTVEGELLAVGHCEKRSG